MILYIFICFYMLSISGHIWQYYAIRYSGDTILENKNISINDFNLTKEINRTSSYTEYGIRDDKQYISKKNIPPLGMTSSCLFEEHNFPSLYRLDVSTSRSFNDIALSQEKLWGRSTELVGQHFRFPQALSITYTNNHYEVNIRKTNYDIINIHLSTLNHPIEIMQPIEFFNYVIKYVKFKEKSYMEKYIY